VNNLSDGAVVEYTQSGCEDDWRAVLPAGYARSFHWPFAGEPRTRFTLPSTNQHSYTVSSTGPFPVTTF
jgi:hypothetical protein